MDLGLTDEFKKSLKSTKNYLKAADQSIRRVYGAGKNSDPRLQKELQEVRKDAYILETWGYEALSRLKGDEKQKRIFAAYKRTIGEIYARRAADVAGASDVGLRARPDMDSGRRDTAVYLKGAKEIAEAASEELAAELYEASTQKRSIRSDIGSGAATFDVNITDNPNFVKWFGDSKVVDENGKPLAVYHGTNSEFDTFFMRLFNTESDKVGVVFFLYDKAGARKFGKNVL
jgi:hypothetical protein